MLAAIPIVGWLIQLFFAASMSVPFWFFWTVCGIGEKFFSFLPPAYHSIGFFNCVGIFICVSIVKSVALPSMSASASSGKEK